MIFFLMNRRFVGMLLVPGVAAPGLYHHIPVNTDNDLNPALDNSDVHMATIRVLNLTFAKHQSFKP